MTDNLPAVRPEGTLEVTTADPDSWIPVLANVAELAQRIGNTEFVPKGLRNNVPAVAAAILYGREVGLPPMTALTQTHVIDGKPAMSAEGMRAVVFARGHELVIDETTGAVCTMRARRRGAETWTTITWTIDMARAAGVAGKQVWKNYPRQMLQARATTELCRLVFPDVIHGFRSVEELDDLPDLEGPTEPAAPTTRVSRASKRPAAKKAAVLPSAERPVPVAGPPLPGEDGYDGDQAQTPQPPAEVPLPNTETTSPAGSPAPTMDPSERANGGTPVASRTGTGPAGEVADEPGEGEGEAPEPGSEAPPTPRPASRAQVRMLMARLGTDFEVTVDQDRYDIATALTGRTVESYNDLTATEASRMIEQLADIDDRAGLDALLAELSR